MASKLFRLQNPLPRIVRDSQELTKYYKGFNLVPYSTIDGFTQHGLLRIMWDLYSLSPSKRTCANWVSNWSFDGMLSIVLGGIPNLKVEKSDVEESTQVAVAERLQNYGLELSNIIQVAKMRSIAYSVCGNSFLRYREVSVGSTKKVFISSVHPQSLMPIVREDKNEPISWAISKDFFNHTWSLEDVEVVREYPFFSENNGYRETLITQKNLEAHTDEWGRPEDFASLYSQLAEWMLVLLGAKVASTETVAKKIIVKEGRDPAAYDVDERRAKLRSEKATLKSLVTNDGDFGTVDSITMLEIPYGSTFFKEVDLEINRDVNYYKGALEEHSNFIYQQNNVSKILTNATQVRNGLGGNIKIDEFKVANAGTLKPRQQKEASIWSIVFNLISEFTGDKELKKHSIQFEDRIQSLIDSLQIDETVTAVQLAEEIRENEGIEQKSAVNDKRKNNTNTSKVDKDVKQLNGNNNNNDTV